jgi:hypothetical protein
MDHALSLYSHLNMLLVCVSVDAMKLDICTAIYFLDIIHGPVFI